MHHMGRVIIQRFHGALCGLALHHKRHTCGAPLGDPVWFGLGQIGDRTGGIAHQTAAQFIRRDHLFDVSGAAHKIAIRPACCGLPVAQHRHQRGGGQLFIRPPGQTARLCHVHHGDVVRQFIRQHPVFQLVAQQQNGLKIRL